MLPPDSLSRRPSDIIVRSVSVEGATTVDQATILAIAGLRPGDVIRANATNENIVNAVQALLERKLFSDVKVLVRNVNVTGADLIIVVRENERIAAIHFTGNDELKEKDLLELIPLHPGDIASAYDLHRIGTKIRARYAEEGYLFSKVTVTKSPSITDTGRVDLLVAIEEGPEVHVGSIAFEGNTLRSDDQLASAMEDVQTKSWWQFWRSSKFDRKKLKADEERVVNDYRSNGFIDASVIGDSIDVDPVSGKAAIRIDVREGRQYYLRSVNVTGNTAYPTETILRRLDVEVNSPYDQARLEENLGLRGGLNETSVASLYQDNGYLQFNADRSETRSGDSVDVVVRIQEGPISRIRFVNIVGNTRTKDKVVRRELYTRPGDVFSKAAVIRSLRSLANLNYFNPERLVPDVAPVDNTTVDVTYRVEEKPSDTFNASLGISSQGLTGMAGVTFNNFSITEPFTGGGGQILNFQVEYSDFQRTLLLGLTEPWLFDDPTTLGASMFYQERDLTVASNAPKLTQYGGTVNLGRRLPRIDDYLRGDISLSARFNRLPAGYSDYYQNGSELYTTLSLSRTSIDNPQFPTVGSRFSTAFTYAGFGGDARYVRPEIRTDFFSTLARPSESNPLVLYFGTEMGYVHPYGPLSSVPPSVFYSMGGTLLGTVNSTPLRGYEDQSIGPTRNSFPAGQAYMKLSSELRFSVALSPIPIYILAFAEAGNVWERFAQVDPFDLKRSAGAGIRITVPGVGLLGFDYGYGFDLDSRDNQGGWQFHFQFGR